jgi:superkiller protein 3
MGTEEARDRARGALFEVIENTPEHVQSVLLLGVIALLDEDDESLEAVVPELQGLRASDNGVTPAEHSQIGEVLRSIAALRESTTKEDALSPAQTDIMLYPHLPHGWLNLADTADGDDGDFAAEMAVQVAKKGVPPRGALDAEQLARAYAGTCRAADAQIAILVAPWDKDGWLALADAIWATKCR